VANRSTVTRITICLDKKLLKLVDRRRKAIGASRSGLIAGLARTWLGGADLPPPTAEQSRWLAAYNRGENV
jgi:hypothetical protein